MNQHVGINEVVEIAGERMRVAAIHFRGHERQYFLIDSLGCVALMPSDVVESSRISSPATGTTQQNDAADVARKEKGYDKFSEGPGSTK